LALNQRSCKEYARLQRLGRDLIPENWIVCSWSFPVSFPRLGRSGKRESIEVLGRTESVHSEAGRGRRSGGGHLPQGRDQPGDLLQLEEEVRRDVAAGYAAAEPKAGAANQLEDENGKLRKLVADLSLDREMLQDVIRRKL
jgi:hypothetical protein